MPAPIIKKYADETGKSESEVERLWKETEKLVNDQYPNVEKESDRWYALRVGILKTMLKIDQKEEGIDFKSFLAIKEIVCDE